MKIKLYESQWFSVFHSQRYYTPAFQKNRCFLAGDAAHIFSPVGAQGMNTGFQDAYNLTWKLAYVIREKAKPTLLNSYTEERIPVVKKTLKASDRIFRLLTNQKISGKILRLYVIPVLLKMMFPLLKIRAISRWLFTILSGLRLHYQRSSLSSLTGFQSQATGSRTFFSPTMEKK